MVAAEEAARANQAALGDAHEHTLLAWSNLALVRELSARYDEALELLARELSGFKVRQNQGSSRQATRAYIPQP